MRAARDRRQVTGLARVLSLFVLLCGVAVMHTGVTAAEAGGPDRVDHSMSPVSMMSGEHADQHHAHEGGAPHQHSAAHLCVFVLTDAVAVAGLVLFSWLAVTGWSLSANLPGWRLRRRHPPPGLAPSLAELSILRI